MPARKKRRSITEAEAATNRRIGQRLREAREARGWTLRRLSDETALNYQAIQKYERGSAAIKPGKLKVLAEAFGVTVMYFLEVAGEDARDNEPPKRETLEVMRALQRMQQHQPVRFLAIFKMVKRIARLHE